MTRARPNARRRTADQRRESVLAAAATAFASKGLYGTTTHEIARRAGISQPYVIRLFGSKMNLFIAVLTRALLAADAPGALQHRQRQRILLHALAAQDEPRVRTQLLTAQAGSGADDGPRDPSSAPFAHRASLRHRHSA